MATVELTRETTAKELLNLIHVHHQIYHLENKQTMFVLQVDVRHEATNFVVLYACVAVVLVLLIVLIIVGCVSYEWRHLPVRDNANALLSRTSTNPDYHQATSPTDCQSSAQETISRIDNQKECSCDKSLTEDGLSHRGSLSPARSQRGSIRRQTASLIPHKVTLLILSLAAFISVYAAVCATNSSVHVVFHIPPTIHLDTVEFFFNVEHKNRITLNLWSNSSATSFKVYDLPEVLLGVEKLCDPGNVCSEALVGQGLAGCDSISATCVCPRGYTLRNDYCVDLDECSDGAHSCPDGATCSNTNGSYVCTCPPSHYLSGDGKCTACSTQCLDDHFERVPCSSHSDRICQACDRCEGASYELRPCLSQQNRRCIHAAFPLLKIDSLTSSVRQLHSLFSTPPQRNVHRKRLRVESYSKIFMENLHNNRDLGTTYYVTDPKQMSDFYSFRESGLRVNVGLENVNLVPVYSDVSHDSDNEFIAKNPAMPEGNEIFADIVNNHCRHPIADHYSLTLEIAKDRATEASEVLCTLDMYNGGECPDGVFINEHFIRRSLNDPCHEMGSYPKMLAPASNSIVCTEGNALLTDLFNITPSDVRVVTFPSKLCKQTTFACEQCLEQERCTVGGVLDQQCCQVDCLTMPDCKQSTSQPCTKAPIQCAMGDAYRFTLQSVFANIKNEFRCHLRRKTPDFLYQLWFDIIIPGTDIHSPRYHTTIYAKEPDANGVSHYRVEFLTLEQSLGIEVDDELILVGQNSDGGEWNHFIQSARSRQDAGARRIVPHVISSNIFVVSVQFSRPFGYSTSSWIKEKNCDKDMRSFRAVQRRPENTPGQPVKVTMVSSGKDHYEYRIKPAEKQPQIRLFIPANVSVLSWWFRDKPVQLMITGVLPSATLSLSRDERLWHINISGLMSDCPGYLSIIINDYLEREELFNYDLVIPCPMDFKVLFSIPTWGIRQDRAFEVVFFDSKRTFRIFLMHFWREIGSIAQNNSSHRIRTIDGEGKLVSTVVLLAAVFILGASGIVKVSAEAARNPGDIPIPTHYTVCFSNANQVGEKVDETHEPSKPRSCPVSCPRRLHLLCYVVFKIIYSLLFTFTTFMVVMKLCLPQGCTESLTLLFNCKDSYFERPLHMSTVAEDYYKTEVSRQASLTQASRRACDIYIEELVESIRERVRGIGANDFLRGFLSGRGSFTAVFSAALNQTLSAYHEGLLGLVQEYQRTAETRFQPAAKHYRELLEGFYTSPWFTYPQTLFNLSSSLRSALNYTGEYSGRGVSTADRLQERVAFAEFIGTSRIQTTQRWQSTLLKRYDQIFQDSAHFKTEIESCSASVSSSFHLFPDRMNSTRFVSSGEDYDIVKRMADAESNAESGRVSRRECCEDSEDEISNCVFPMNSIPWALIQIMLFTVDITLLIYRLTHIYVIVQKFKTTVDGAVTPFIATVSNNYFVLETSNGTDGHIFIGKTHPKNWERSENDSFPQHSSFHTDIQNSSRHVWVTAKPLIIQSKPNSSLVAQDDRIYCQLSYRNGLTPESAHPTGVQGGRAIFRVACVCFHWLRDTNTLPKFLFIFVLILLLSTVQRLANQTLLRYDLLPDLIGVYWSKSAWLPNVKAMERDLFSGHGNSSSLSVLYQGHMVFELSQIQAAIVLFQNGFDKTLRILCIEASRFAAGAPNISTTCDTVATAAKVPSHFDWKIPILPCNFLPISPQSDLSGTLLASWNELADLVALSSQCLCTLVHASINVVAVLLTVIVALKTLDLLAIYLFTRPPRTFPSVPSDTTAQQKHVDCPDHDTSRCLPVDGTQCIEDGLGIQLLSDLHKTTGTVQKGPVDCWQAEGATIQFSETDV